MAYSNTTYKLASTGVNIAVSPAVATTSPTMVTSKTNYVISNSQFAYSLNGNVNWKIHWIAIGY